MLTITNFEKRDDNDFVKIDEEENAAVPLLSQNSEEDKAARELPMLEIVSSSKFKTLYVLGVCHLFYGYFYTNVYKDYGKEYINDDKFLTLVGAIAALFNGFFKLLWASLLDYYPFRRIYGGLILLEIGLIVLINVAVYNKWAFMVVTCLTYMCDGSLTSMLPALTVQQFGLIRGPQIYSYLFSVFGLSCLMSIFVVTNFKHALGYTGMFMLSFCFSSVAAICTYIFDEKNLFNYVKAYNAYK